MFERIGLALVRRRRLVLVATVALVVAAGALGGNVIERLTSGGFEDESSESFQAAEVLKEEFGVEAPNLVLLVTAESGSVDDPAVAEQGGALTSDLAGEEGIEGVASYWSTGAPTLRSADSSQALVVATISGDADEARDRIEAISPKFNRNGDVIDVKVGGFEEVFRAVSVQVEDDLLRAEMIAFPITLILLLFVFGSLVSAALPMAIGGIAIVGSFFILRVLTDFTDVSIFALNLITAMGLGLGIDYSLFVVSRFREELRRGLEPHAAVVQTVKTAGRTVAFSGITVALSLSALLIFPLTFLRSFAYAGVAVVILAALAAVIFLPALLAVLGHRVDKLAVWRRKERAEGEGFWHRAATTVMRRPIPIATAVIVFLLLLGAPFLGVEFGRTDHRVLPAESEVRQTMDSIGANFSVNNAESLQIVATGIGDAAQSDQVDAYAAALSEVDGAASVEALTGTYTNGERVAEPNEASARFANDNATWLSVMPGGDTTAAEREELVRDVRSLDAPFQVEVAGLAAADIDGRESLFSRLPLAAALIGAATFVLLFLMFGSVLVPFKAIVLNLLSLTATFGALVWIFQRGNFSGVLDFTATGALDVTMPILMFCIAFGLSMDYEVFLLSRIKEEYDRTGDNTVSVALGLERTGRIVTAAAVLLSIVFVAFATSSVTFIKLFGVGLTIAVLVDASLVRATLVPAFMRLAGRANWWAPKWMRKVYDRFGITESESVPSPTARPAESGSNA
jgi:putative drug exporter of the RND superfamily